MPPATGPPFLCSGAALLLFSHVKRVGTDSPPRVAPKASRGPSEGSKTDTRSPDLTNVLGFSHTEETKNKTTLKARSHRCSRAINKPKASTKRAPKRATRSQVVTSVLGFSHTREAKKTTTLKARSHWCSRAINKKSKEQNNTESQTSPVLSCNQ